LNERLNEQIQEALSLYGVSVPYDPLALFFLDRAIRELSHHQGQVVVLVDEYDKPTLDWIEEPEKAKANRDVLRQFYGILKGMDEHLRFVFLAGVTKFSQGRSRSVIRDLFFRPKGIDRNMKERETRYTKSEWLLMGKTGLSARG